MKSLKISISKSPPIVYGADTFQFRRSLAKNLIHSGWSKKEKRVAVTCVPLEKSFLMSFFSSFFIVSVFKFVSVTLLVCDLFFTIDWHTLKDFNNESSTKIIARTRPGFGWNVWAIRIMCPHVFWCRRYRVDAVFSLNALAVETCRDQCRFVVSLSAFSGRQIAGNGVNTVFS